MFFSINLKYFKSSYFWSPLKWSDKCSCAILHFDHYISLKIKAQHEIHLQLCTWGTSDYYLRYSRKLKYSQWIGLFLAPCTEGEFQFLEDWKAVNTLTVVQQNRPGLLSRTVCLKWWERSKLKMFVYKTFPFQIVNSSLSW